MQQNTRSTATTRNPNYKEHLALQQLMVNIDEACNDDAVVDDEFISDIQISIGGKQVAFLLGGPQQEALYAFVRHVASENGYDVNIHKNTVTI